MTWTSDDLDSAVRRLCRIRDGDSSFGISDVLAFADEEILSTILPVIRSARAEFGVKRHDVAIVSGQDAYRIPPRAQGGTLRDVTLLDALGEEVCSVDELELNEKWRGHAGGWLFGERMAYCVEGDELRIVPEPTSANYSLRMRYYLRPSKLVPVAEAFFVTSISGFFRYNGTPPASITITTPVDVIESRPNFDVLLLDRVPTAINAAYIQLAELADEPGITTGIRTVAKPEMYMALASETPVVQVPDVFYPLVVRATSVRALEALGDARAMAIAEQKLQTGLEKVLTLIEPRNEGEGRVIVNWDSPLRRGRSGGWR